MQVEIDEGSGFCFGVTTAIQKVEEELAKGITLYCLGDIVHNGKECERLKGLGLITINHHQFSQLRNAIVLLRAHGEPPATYELAKRNNIEIIDATCPVVLRLQKRILKEFESIEEGEEKQIVIYGKNGHAEVLGLVGQTQGKALVIESPEEANRLDFTKEIRLYAQTTQSLDGFQEVVKYINERIQPEASFKYYDTICRQVANRMPHIQQFAKKHDLIFFVCGRKSSNGKVLFEECKKVNNESYLIEQPNEIDFMLTKNKKSVGICGATSTPKWLMENCKETLSNQKTEITLKETEKPSI
ncbi:MAG: 4-hydroxy-3-methylbut-2-enyl diphosphate reductase [Phocaeicola sp.]